jgi:putative N-acetyltransferase (TIGR04045 family)
MRKISVRQAVKKEEIREVFEIREEVFVKEQKIFDRTDKDEQDGQSLYLIATIHDQIAGVVRVYPIGDDEWVGGRLAVKKKFRGTRAGWLLVKEAVSLVKRNQCRKFTATIQEENVKFFKRLGWEPRGEFFVYQGKKHLVMEADLESYVGREMN